MDFLTWRALRLLFRTVIGWFSKGIPHGKDIRLGLQDITVVADVQRLLDQARRSLAA